MVIEKGNLQVLIADPDPVFRQEARLHVDELGNCATLEASSVAEVLGILNERPIDLLISSYQMPRSSGLALLKLMKRQKKYLNIVVFLISTPETNEPEKIKLAAANNVDAYFLKPVDWEKFSQTLAGVQT